MSSDINTVELWPTLYEEISSKEWICPLCGSDEMHINLWWDCVDGTLHIDDDNPAWCRVCNGPVELGI